MQLSESPGTIAIPTSEIGRFAIFTVALVGTNMPSGSSVSLMASASVTENLNSIIRQLEDKYEWVWILGDDHVWTGDTLMVMLETMDKNPEIDILVPLVVKRNPPWHLVLFHSAGYDKEGMPAWLPYKWSEVPESGVFEVEAAGSAGMLIKREVLDTMGEPWFASTNGVYLNEDVMFCSKAKELGFRVFATADAGMGHLGIFNVHPKFMEGRWGALTEFSSPEEQFREIFMPVLDENPSVHNGR